MTGYKNHKETTEAERLQEMLDNAMATIDRQNRELKEYNRKPRDKLTENPR